MCGSYFKKVMLAVSISTATLNASAGGVVLHNENGKYVKIGGRIQMQYLKNRCR